MTSVIRTWSRSRQKYAYPYLSNITLVTLTSAHDVQKSRCAAVGSMSKMQNNGVSCGRRLTIRRLDCTKDVGSMHRLRFNMNFHSPNNGSKQQKIRKDDTMPKLS